MQADSTYVLLPELQSYGWTHKLQGERSKHTSETMKHNVEWNDVKKDVAKWQGVVAAVNQHPYWWVTFRLLSKISYEAQKILDLDSETLIYNKHG